LFRWEVQVHPHKRMHLRDVNGREVSITVDVVDTMSELLEG
jgi:hypothetical protein